MAVGCKEPFSTKRRMSRIEQFDGGLKGVIDPKLPICYAVETVEMSPKQSKNFCRVYSNKPLY
jgi:hypothetical protein